MAKVPQDLKEHMLPKKAVLFPFLGAGKTQATKNGQLEFVKTVSSCCNEILTAKTRTVGYFGIV